MRHIPKILVLLLALAILGCGGGGGGKGRPASGNGGGAGIPGPQDRAAIVAKIMSGIAPREKRELFFGEYTDQIQAVLNEQAVHAFEIFEEQLKAYTERQTRHTGQQTGPDPGSGFAMIPVDFGPIPVGPFTLKGQIAYGTESEKGTVGYKGKAEFTVTGELFTIPMKATLRLAHEAATEYAPSVSGKIAGTESLSVSFAAAAQIAGHHSYVGEIAFDKIVDGTVDDDAELATLDSRSNYTTRYAFDGNVREGSWSGTVTGANPGFDGTKSKPGSTAVNPPTTLPPGDVEGTISMGEGIDRLGSIEQYSLYAHARRVWRGGYCVAVEHTNEEHRYLEPGETFEVDLQTKHRLDQSSVSQVKYTSSAPADLCEQTSPGHFKIKVPNDAKKADQLLRRVKFEATSCRGKAEIEHQYWSERLRIDRLSIDESTGVLTLTGSFIADDNGTRVTVGGTPVTVLTWKEKEIRCRIPSSGPGSCGDVVATSGEDAATNAVQLTSWRGQITYAFNAAGGLRQRVTWDVHLRAGLNGNVAARLDPASDSTANYEALGAYETSVEDTNHTVSWSGSGALPMGSTPAPGGYFASFMGMIDPTTKKLSFVASGTALTGMTMTHISERPPDPPHREITTGLLVDTGYLSELLNGQGQIEMSIDSSYDVLPGSKSANVTYPIITGQESGTVTISWSGMTAEFPPKS